MLHTGSRTQECTTKRAHDSRVCHMQGTGWTQEYEMYRVQDLEVHYIHSAGLSRPLCVQVTIVSSGQGVSGRGGRIAFRHVPAEKNALNKSQNYSLRL